MFTAHFAVIMKRKASQYSVTPCDPRWFNWNVFHRDQFVEFGERVWLKTEEQYGTVVSATAAVANDDPAPEINTKNDPQDPERTNQQDVKDNSNLRLVTLQDGSTASYHRPYDAIRMYKRPAIVIAYSTDDFRLLAQTQDLGPSVLEIGCSTGQTSRLLWKRCDNWLGWDTGKAMVDTLQQEISDSSSHDTTKNFLCSKIDPIVDPENAWTMVRGHFEAIELSIMIDIGGNRDAKAVAKILKWALGLQKEIQMIVIKSEEMHALKVDPLHWFLSIDEVDIKTFPTHPLKAPKRCSPQDESLPICRYYNYHPQGCKKGPDCEFDHTHCHWCLQAGHIALSCPKMHRRDS